MYNQQYWYIFSKPYNFHKIIHPGGKSAINIGKGRDSTFLLVSYHHKNIRYLIDRIEKYYVKNEIHIDPEGKYQTSAQIKAIIDDPLRKDLMIAYKQYKRKNGYDNHTMSWNDLTWMCFNYVLFLICMYHWFQNGSILMGVMMALLHTISFFQNAHDASHYSSSRSNTINCMYQWLSIPYTYEPMCWHLQHNYSHHIHTNDIHADIDVHHGKKPFMLLRTYKSEKWKIWFPISIWIYFIGSGLITTFDLSIIVPIDRLLGSLYSGLGFELLNIVPCNTKFHEYEVFRIITGLCISLMFLFLPLFHQDAFNRSIWHNYLLCMLPFHITSVIFMILTQSSHFNTETMDAGNNEALTFYQKQILTSMDYSIESTWVTRLTGGLNMQSLHHAIPFMHNSHFVKFYPYYKQVCDKHNLTLVVHKSVFHAFYQYLKYVINLNVYA